MSLHMSKSLLGGLCVIGYGVAGQNVVDVAYKVFSYKVHVSVRPVSPIFVSQWVLYVYWERAVK